MVLFGVKLLVSAVVKCHRWTQGVIFQRTKPCAQFYCSGKNTSRQYYQQNNHDGLVVFILPCTAHMEWSAVTLGHHSNTSEHIDRWSQYRWCQSHCNMSDGMMTCDCQWLLTTDDDCKWLTTADEDKLVITSDGQWWLMTESEDRQRPVMLLLTDHSRWSLVSFTHQRELMTAGDGSCCSWWQRDVTARGGGDIIVVACLTLCCCVPYSGQFCKWLYSCSSPRGEGHNRVQGMVYLHLHENKKQKNCNTLIIYQVNIVPTN